MDKGPWVAVKWDKLGWIVASDDFTHDVYLEIYGDLHAKGPKTPNKGQYAKWLANELNSCAALRALLADDGR